MKCFTCPLDKIVLGIPSRTITRIIKAPRVQDAPFTEEGGETCISLPALFQQGSVPAPHGMILKDREDRERLILLVPRIITDLDIPEEKIRRLPGLVEERLPCFFGAFFSGKELILLVDPEKLRDLSAPKLPRRGRALAGKTHGPEKIFAGQDPGPVPKGSS